MASPSLRIAVGSDQRTELTDSLVDELRRRSIDVELFGALTTGDPNWPEVARKVAEGVASGRFDQGVLCCWTGTGVAMAANKVAGARAALCADAETARGARKWNDANILCLSLRLTSITLAGEIVDAWIETGADESERANIQRLKAMDEPSTVCVD